MRAIRITGAFALVVLRAACGGNGPGPEPSPSASRPVSVSMEHRHGGRGAQWYDDGRRKDVSGRSLGIAPPLAFALR